MSAGPFSDLRTGDAVELLEEASDITWGGVKVPVGSKGKLGRLYRIQDDKEIWAMWLDQPISFGGVKKSLVGVDHLQVRKLGEKS